MCKKQKIYVLFPHEFMSNQAENWIASRYRRYLHAIQVSASNIYTLKWNVDINIKNVVKRE